MNITAYLHEAHDDPKLACQEIRRHNITSIVISKLWGKHLHELPDRDLLFIRDIVVQHNLTTFGICNDGFVEIEKVQIYCALAKFFNAKLLIFDIHNSNVTDEWIRYISGLAIDYNLVPLLKLSAHLVVDRFLQSKRWKILYDPAELVKERSVDPFVKFWVPLKRYIYAINIADVKTGHGYCMIGNGNGRILDTLRDAPQELYILLKPNLGRKYGSARTKPEVFSFAVSALRSMIDDQLE